MHEGVLKVEYDFFALTSRGAKRLPRQSNSVPLGALSTGALIPLQHPRELRSVFSAVK